MKFYTSYYGAMREIPDNYLCIGISRIVPFIDRDNFVSGEPYSRFAPPYDLLNDFKAGRETEDGYKRRYVKYILSQFTQYTLPPFLDAIVDFAKQDKYDAIVFMCYEKPKDFCHRHIFAKLLKLMCGIECSELELKHEHSGAVLLNDEGKELKETELF